VIVVDSYSTDKTKEIALASHAGFYENKYSNHSSQWNWTLQNTEVSTDWILALDADFIVTENLKEKIELFLANEEKGYNGFYVIHEYKFWGSRIRHGGIKKYWLRGIRKGHGMADESDLVDFRFNIEGRLKNIDGIVIEDNEKDNDLSFWVRKQDLFSLRLAVEEELRRKKLLHWGGRKSILGTTDEKFKVFRDVWMKVPLFIRPILYFMYRYFIALGFLDGVGGFLYHFQQGLWLRMIVDMKIYELRQYKLSDEALIGLSQNMLRQKTGSLRELLNAEKRNDFV
jgi:glycosyltransferase involved in cell wall biosynthesis